MSRKKPALGRHLGVLLGDATLAPVSTTQRASNSDGETQQQLSEIALSQIQPGPFQPRREIAPEALEELAQSIRQQGVIQPIVVRQAAQGHYELLAGERRWRAAQLAELTTIPAVVRDISDEQAMLLGLIENIQRENLNPLEEALALQRLIEEFGMTHASAAVALGKSRTTISNLLRLLGLHPEVKRLLSQGKLDMGHARALLALPQTSQPMAALEVISKQLSARATEALVRQWLTAEEKTSGKTASLPSRDPDIEKLQRRLGDSLGAAVKIDHHAKGKGQLKIRYESLGELERILAYFEA